MAPVVRASAKLPHLAFDGNPLIKTRCL